MSEAVKRLLNDKESKLQSMMRFAYQSAPDEFTRCQATTALVVTLWQLAGAAMPFPPPSLLLASASGADHDPLDKMVRGWGEGPGYTYDYDSREARQARANVVDTLQRFLTTRAKGGMGAEFNFLQIRKHFVGWLREGFGGGKAAPYSIRMHPKLECVTHTSNEVILRLDGPKDWEQFLSDVSNERASYTMLKGYNHQLEYVPKVAYLSGSVPPERWHPELADTLVSHALPVLLLPHATDDALAEPRAVAFTLLIHSMGLAPRTSGHPILLEPPQTSWFQQYESKLRKRLMHFPGSYEAFIQRVVREIHTICHAILFMARSEADDDARCRAFATDLYKMCFRSIVVGVEAFTFHGLGFDAGCERKLLVELLSLLRNSGPLSRRELQRKVPSLNARQRDELLEVLAEQKLVRLEDKSVEAVSWEDFVQELPKRTDLPAPKYEGHAFMKAETT